MTKKKTLWLVVVLVVVATAVAAFVWYQNNQSDETTGTEEIDSRQSDGPIIMSGEERYRFENIKRAEGIIENVDGSKLTLDQSEGETLEFQLIGETQYVKGEQAYAGDKQSVSSGKKASISYDQNNMYVQTVWVDYDVANSN